MRLIVLILESKSASIAEAKNNVCVTTDCAKYAEEMVEKIDYTIDACDDFYSFACGQFIRNTRIPEDKVSVNTFTIIEDVLQDQLKTIVASPIDKNDIEPFKMVKELYSACMNEGNKKLFADDFRNKKKL